MDKSITVVIFKLVVLFNNLSKVEIEPLITAIEAAALLHSRQNKIVTPVEILCKYIRVLFVVLKRLHVKHADNLKCDEWGCEYLNRCGFLTGTELGSFGVQSGCKYYKKWSFENIDAERKELTREATNHLGPSITAIHLTKTNKEFAKLGYVPPSCKLDGPLQTDDRGEKLQEYNVLNSRNFTEYANGYFGKALVDADKRGGKRTTSKYQKDHLTAFRLAREAYTDNDDNPWMYSLEFLTYVALCAFVPDNSISHLSPADGYREVCKHFENDTIAEMFGQAPQPSTGFWENEHRKDQPENADLTPLTAADLTAEQIAEALNAIMQHGLPPDAVLPPAKRAKNAEVDDCDNEPDANFRSVVAEIASKRKQSTNSPVN
jgi:hypothetical protein